MCDSEKSFSEMAEDGRNILLELLDMVIYKSNAKINNFPKPFIECFVGYISNPSKNGALKSLGFFDENNWDNTEFYIACNWNWRTEEILNLWTEEYQKYCGNGRKTNSNNIEKLIIISKKYGYEKDVPNLEKLLIYMKKNPGKHINLENFVFDDNYKSCINKC